jgi:hypothetical protein
VLPTTRTNSVAVLDCSPLIIQVTHPIKQERF